MFFSILDYEFNDKFYSEKMKLIPSNDVPLARFTTTLKKWIINVILKVIATKFVLLNSHYKYDRLNDMAKLLNIVDKKEMVSYL
jgi:hypothetical protein